MILIQRSGERLVCAIRSTWMTFRMIPLVDLLSRISMIPVISILQSRQREPILSPSLLARGSDLTPQLTCCATLTLPLAASVP